MEGLTKENFFNEVAEKYPLAHKSFCDWIDQQKVNLNWEQLFNENKNFYQTKNHAKINISSCWDAPKFHDLPFELQYGILIKFIDIKLSGQPMVIFFDALKMKECLNEIFLFMQRTLSKQ